MNETFATADARVTVFADAPSWDGVASVSLGKFSCASAAAGAEVLAQAERAVRAQGVTRLLGPMDGTTWNPYRLVIDSDGSAPFLMEPRSGAHDHAAFETAGFVEVSRYFSARIALESMQNPAPVGGDIRVETWDGTDPEGHFAQVYELSLKAFAGNRFYTPLGLEAFLAMYLPYVPVLQPDFVLFARDGAGALVGFLFGIPNYGQAAQPTQAILKTYASVALGAGHALAHVFHANALAAGFTHAIHALIHDANQSGERSARLGAQVFRRYALMGKILDANPA